MIKISELQAFWDSISNIEYLVLRNYENMLSDINNGGDIDLLLREKAGFISAVNAVPLNQNADCYNYKVQIGNASVPIDLRVVGDGYYDAAWEHNMLLNRQLYNKSFFVMQIDDYNYSIIYHCLLHKDEIPPKYEVLFFKMGITDKGELVKKLDIYMRKHKYRYVIPDDRGVEFCFSMYLRRRIRSLFWSW